MNKLEPLNIVYILQQQQNPQFFSHLTDSNYLVKTLKKYCFDFLPKMHIITY